MLRKRLAVPLVIILALAGCSSADKSGGAGGLAAPTGAYADEIVAAQAQATSELESEILTDGKVTRTEYQTAVEAFVDCQLDQGVKVITNQSADTTYEYEQQVSGLGEDGIFDSSLADARQTEAEAISSTCAIGTTILIEPIYVATIKNPERKDTNVLMATCLVRHDVVDAPFTGEDFGEWLSSRPENGGTPSDADADINLDDPAYLACASNPSQ